MPVDPDSWRYLDLVIKNFGETPAYKIKVTLPGLHVVPYSNMLTGDEVTELYIPDSIVVLAPGQEWRTVWESAIRWSDYELKRKHSPHLNLRELGSVFIGDVTYQDVNGKPFSNPVRLDAKIFWNKLSVKKEEERDR